ncbi:hypothetical protein BC832DRAFT_362454 [Gaertneriomyces semiglobifer]|nr:hypothetical protein BC832DRAFT_362454 [Gaertneriomyces semiglobifer]
MGNRASRQNAVLPQTVPLEPIVPAFNPGKALNFGPDFTDKSRPGQGANIQPSGPFHDPDGSFGWWKPLVDSTSYFSDEHRSTLGNLYAKQDGRQPTTVIKSKLHLPRNSIKYLNIHPPPSNEPSLQSAFLEFLVDATAAFTVRTCVNDPASSSAHFGTAECAAASGPFPAAMRQIIRVSIPQIGPGNTAAIVIVIQQHNDDTQPNILNENQQHITFALIGGVKSTPVAADDIEAGEIQGTSSHEIKVVKQELLIGRKAYALSEIYGFSSEDPSNECVVCLCEHRDVMMVPCRHLCVCSGCADSIRIPNGTGSNARPRGVSKCPICRAAVSGLLRFILPSAPYPTRQSVHQMMLDTRESVNACSRLSDMIRTSSISPGAPSPEAGAVAADGSTRETVSGAT